MWISSWKFFAKFSSFKYDLSAKSRNLSPAKLLVSFVVSLCDSYITTELTKVSGYITTTCRIFMCGITQCTYQTTWPMYQRTRRQRTKRVIPEFLPRTTAEEDLLELSLMLDRRQTKLQVDRNLYQLIIGYVRMVTFVS